MKETNSKSAFITSSRDFTVAAIPFLLNAYKHGLYDLGDAFSPLFLSLLEKVEKNNYAVIHKDNHSGHEVAIMQLTQKGAAFIENNFLDILTNLSPYYIFPVIRSGERVELLMDVKNEQDEAGHLVKKVVHSPSGSSCLDKGVYKVLSCDSGSISISDDCAILYRLRLAEFRDKLRLYSPDLKSESEELKTRFGIIRVRTLVGRLQDKVNTIRLAELVDELYSLPHTKDRLNNG